MKRIKIGGIIYSAYNPSTAFDNYDEGDDLVVKITKR